MSNPQAPAADPGVALIQRYYAAFNNGDWNGMLDCLSDDVVHDINQGKREAGKPAFRAFLAHMERCYREQLRDMVVMPSEDGSRAAAEFVVHGEYLSTDEGLPPANGQKYVLPAGAFFDLRGGKIARVTNYYNLPDWTAQVVGKSG
jgi:steroid delta-isomerase-like uncharacterized protein